MLKNQKGITLVALVITIIVLLILAGVAITLTVNQDSLFDKANNAAIKWNESVTNEQNSMNDLMNSLNTYAPNTTP